MVDSMTHRGPDDRGILVDGDVGIGMRRLSIIDLEGGHQPIYSEDRSLAVVFNGEIYNYRELAGQLEAHGHRFGSRSDTEVIVHAYEQWGLDGLARLSGMFGIAIWDSRNRTLVLARDPAGIKPLYFSADHERVLFGSELRAIFASGRVQVSMDDSVLGTFVAIGYIPAPHTAFAGLEKLRPGHALVCTPAGARVHRFESAPSVGAATGRLPSADSLVGDLALRVRAAVGRQMVADVPVGALLSGGVDSAAVATIMTEVANEPIRTFTVGFGPGYAFDELDAARRTAQRIRSHHTEVTIRPEEFFTFLPTAVRHMEEPIATASAYAFYRISQEARSTVKVVLTGQGADEPFGGYARYLGERYSSLYRRLPAPIRSAAAGILSSALRAEQIGRGIHSLQLDNNLDRFMAIYSVIPRSQRQDLLRGGDQADIGSRSAFQMWLADVSDRDSLTQLLYLDSRTSLPDNLLLYSDKLSMACGLEARVPFLDPDVVSFAHDLPAHLKVGLRGRKLLLKKALSRWVPAEVRRRRKMGFVVPVGDWFRGRMGEVVEDLLVSEGSASGEYFDRHTISVLVRQHRSRQADHKRILFHLLTFELWYQSFIFDRTTHLHA